MNLPDEVLAAGTSIRSISEFSASNKGAPDMLTALSPSAVRNLKERLASLPQRRMECSPSAFWRMLGIDRPTAEAAESYMKLLHEDGIQVVAKSPRGAESRPRRLVVELLATSNGTSGDPTSAPDILKFQFVPALVRAGFSRDGVVYLDPSDENANRIGWPRPSRGRGVLLFKDDRRERADLLACVVAVDSAVGIDRPLLLSALEWARSLDAVYCFVTNGCVATRRWVGESPPEVVSDVLFPATGRDLDSGNESFSSKRTHPLLIDPASVARSKADLLNYATNPHQITDGQRAADHFYWWFLLLVFGAGFTATIIESALAWSRSPLAGIAVILLGIIGWFAMLFHGGAFIYFAAKSATSSPPRNLWDQLRRTSGRRSMEMSSMTTSRGSIGTAILWMFAVSMVLFWIPVLGGFLAGFVGGRRAGGVGNAIVACLVPGILFGACLALLATGLTALPLLGAIAGVGGAAIALSHVGPLVLGAIIGSATQAAN